MADMKALNDITQVQNDNFTQISRMMKDKCLIHTDFFFFYIARTLTFFCANKTKKKSVKHFSDSPHVAPSSVFSHVLFINL
jgi:hypothetical protein